MARVPHDGDGEVALYSRRYVYATIAAAYALAVGQTIRVLLLVAQVEEPSLVPRATVGGW
jgi:hypothetical protein